MSSLSTILENDDLPAFNLANISPIDRQLELNHKVPFPFSPIQAAVVFKASKILGALLKTHKVDPFDEFWSNNALRSPLHLSIVENNVQAMTSLMKVALQRKAAPFVALRTLGYIGSEEMFRLLRKVCPGLFTALNCKEAIFIAIRQTRVLSNGTMLYLPSISSTRICQLITLFEKHVIGFTLAGNPVAGAKFPVARHAFEHRPMDQLLISSLLSRGLPFDLPEYTDTMTLAYLQTILTKGKELPGLPMYFEAAVAAGDVPKVFAIVSGGYRLKPGFVFPTEGDLTEDGYKEILVEVRGIRDRANASGSGSGSGSGSETETASEAEEGGASPKRDPEDGQVLRTAAAPPGKRRRGGSLFCPEGYNAVLKKSRNV